MKTSKIVSFIALFVSISLFAAAQQKKETIPVSGNCGMCKNNIENAAKKAGASNASWDQEAKTLTVKYNASSTDAAKIQQAVAEAGYDTRDVKASDAAYDKLHSCCKYDRAASVAAEKACCDKKDGKCDMDACKDKGCCSKDGKPMTSEEGKKASCCS